MRMLYAAFGGDCLHKWDVRFMDMAHLVSTWTSCYTPGRAIGAVIVKDKRARRPAHL